MYPYNNSNAMIVAEVVEDILGDSLLSLQLGNEPDLYAGHGRRPQNYSLEDYFTEFESYLVDFNSSAAPEKKIILGPRSAKQFFLPPCRKRATYLLPSSVCSDWSTQQVFDQGYLEDFGTNLNAIGLMHYPNNNCAFGGLPPPPQSVLPDFLTHESAVLFAQMYESIVRE